MASLPIPPRSLPRTGSGSSTNRCSPATRVATRLRHHQGQSRAGIQQPRQQRRGARQKVLQVVQHQKHPPRPQARQQRLASVPAGFLADSQGMRERGRQHRHLGQAGQRHPGHAIGMQTVNLRLDPRNIHHQTGLPHAARTQHRDQPDPGPGQQRPDTADRLPHARPGRCAVPAPRLPAAAAPPRSGAGPAHPGAPAAAAHPGRRPAPHGAPRGPAGRRPARRPGGRTGPAR